MSEQGTISLAGVELQVSKHGWTSGHWTLERNGESYVDAQKPSVMFRSFDLTCGGEKFVVKARSPFSRCFDILSEGKVVGAIQPAHLFTRRATINCSDNVPELAQLFAFWLAVILWRRQSRSNNK